MHSLRPIVGTAVLAALAAGSWLAWRATRPERAGEPVIADQEAKEPRKAPRSRMVRQEVPAIDNPAANQPVTAAQTARVDAALAERIAGTPRPVGENAAAAGRAPAHLTRQELQARAARIEQESNHELRRLVPLLNLSEAQQEQVFNALAVNSPLWVPGMATAAPGGDTTPVGGATASTADVTVAPATSLPGQTMLPGSPGETAATDAPVDPLASILPFLTPEQQQALLADEMDKVAWWEEIIPQLLPPDVVPGIDGNTDTKAYTGSDTLD